jgi:hypothetical protein
MCKKNLVTNDHLDSHLDVIGLHRFVKLKGPMELLEIDYFFQCLACFEFFFQTHGVVGFGGLKLSLHLFVFNQQIITIVPSIDK